MARKVVSAIYLAVLLLNVRGYAEEPWGKDAHLVHHEHPYKRPPSKRGPAQGLIRFHQLIISPADGPRSHYFPSSSQYTLDAINQYGFLTGYWMGCDRLMRENDQEWLYPRITVGKSVLKYNPIP